MTTRIQVKRGLKANLPNTGLAPGEPLFTTDRGTLHVATGATTHIPAVPAVDDLQTLAAVNPANDMLLIHDADGTGQKEKKITVAEFRQALNIPAGAADEKVAVVQGGASGYLYGTDGTDGVIRVDNTLTITKDASNGFVTLSVAALDGGTF